MGNSHTSQNMRTIEKNMLWNSVGTLFYFGCQWLLTVLVVRFNGGYRDAGMLSLAISITTPLYYIACLNLRTFQVSELEEKFSDGDYIANRILTSIVALCIGMGFVLYKHYDFYESQCIIAYILFKISESFVDVLHGIDQKAWRLDIAGKSFLLRGVVSLIAFVLGEVAFESLLVAIILMAGSVYLIVYFYDYRICKREIQFNQKATKNGVYGLVKIGIPLAAYSTMLNLIASVPRIQIEAKCGQELLGIFASISTPTLLIPQIASFFFSPLMGVFAEQRQAKDRKGLWKLLLICVGAIIVIGILAVMAGIFFGEWVLVLLFRESIRTYVHLLIPIIFTAVLTAVIWLLCGLLIVFKDYYVLTGMTFVSLIVCLFISPSLITAQQLMGAVLALSTALGLECILLGIRFIFVLSRSDREDRNDKIENSHSN